MVNKNHAMIKTMAQIFYLFILTAIILIPQGAKSSVVVELFSYPTCQEHTHDGDKIIYTDTSSPRAENIFIETIEQNPDIIALNCHMDYSSYEMEDEAMASKTTDSFCTQRNYYYYNIMNRYDELPIGDVIINGTYDSMGKSQTLLNTAITLAKAKLNTQNITMLINSASIDVTLPKIRLEKPIPLTLIAYSTTKSEKTIGGEDGGGLPSIYQNIITDFKKMPDWDGSYYNLSIPTGTLNGNAFAIIAQKQSGDIIAAGKAE